MSTHSVPTLTGLLSSDTASSATSLVERDSNGDSALAKVGTIDTGLVNSGYTKLKVQTKTANFTVDETAAASTNGTVFLCDTTAGSVTLTLPVAATSTNRVLHVVKTVAANSLIIDGNASEAINGATTKTTTGQYATAILFCDGSNWFAIFTGTWT